MLFPDTVHVSILDYVDGKLQQYWLKLTRIKSFLYELKSFILIMTKLNKTKKNAKIQALF